jgi:hypothetical protein
MFLREKESEKVSMWWKGRGDSTEGWREAFNGLVPRLTILLQTKFFHPRLYFRGRRIQQPPTDLSRSPIDSTGSNLEEFARMEKCRIPRILPPILLPNYDHRCQTSSASFFLDNSVHYSLKSLIDNQITTRNHHDGHWSHQGSRPRHRARWEDDTTCPHQVCVILRSPNFLHRYCRCTHVHW